jgi:hypothetical protein
LEHLLGAAEFDAGSGIAALVVREKAEAALVEGNAAEAEALSTEVRACGGARTPSLTSLLALSSECQYKTAVSLCCALIMSFMYVEYWTGCSRSGGLHLVHGSRFVLVKL